jgi:hypothetical protein
MRMGAVTAAWCDAMAAAQDARKVEYDRLHAAETWENALDAMPLPDTAPPMIRWDSPAVIRPDHAPVVIFDADAKPDFSEYSRLANAELDAAAPRTIGEKDRHWLDAEDRTPIATGTAFLDYLGRDRLSNLTPDYRIRQAHPRRVDVLSMEEATARTGRTYYKLRIRPADGKVRTVNCFDGMAVDNLMAGGPGRYVLHLQRNGGWINVQGACKIDGPDDDNDGGGNAPRGDDTVEAFTFEVSKSTEYSVITIDDDGNPWHSSTHYGEFDIHDSYGTVDVADYRGRLWNDAAEGCDISVMDHAPFNQRGLRHG